jgi:hypothetical protein
MFEETRMCQRTKMTTPGSLEKEEVRARVSTSTDAELHDDNESDN